MTPKVSIPHYLTIYRLGTLYANYRLIIALSLTLIFFITIENQGLQYEYPNLYFYALMFYVGSSLAQLLLLKYFQHAISAQIVGLFAVDLVFLSSLTFALGGPNISIGLLFVISVFASNFLLSKHQALFMTLVAVICVVYQQFVGSLFNHTDLNNIGNSVFLAFLFFVVYGLGQFSIQRFQLLESLTTYQSNELFKFQTLTVIFWNRLKWVIWFWMKTAKSLSVILPLVPYSAFHLYMRMSNSIWQPFSRICSIF